MLITAESIRNYKKRDQVPGNKKTKQKIVGLSEKINCVFFFQGRIKLTVHLYLLALNGYLLGYFVIVMLFDVISYNFVRMIWLLLLLSGTDRALAGLSLVDNRDNTNSTPGLSHNLKYYNYNNIIVLYNI